MSQQAKETPSLAKACPCVSYSDAGANSSGPFDGDVLYVNEQTNHELTKALNLVGTSDLIPLKNGLLCTGYLPGVVRSIVGIIWSILGIAMDI